MNCILGIIIRENLQPNFQWILNTLVLIQSNIFENLKRRFYKKIFKEFVKKIINLRISKVEEEYNIVNLIIN